MAIILCKCERKSSAEPDLESIRVALRQKGERVLVGAGMCRSGIEPALKAVGKPEPIVFGGCRCEDHRDEFRDSMRKHGFDPFSLRLVSLLRGESPEHAVLMLHAAATRMKLFSGVLPDNLRPRLGRINREMTRRHFLKYPRVRYDIIPAIDDSRCRSRERGCQLCQRTCGEGALSVGDEGLMALAKEKCTGCGICVNACPVKAIQYPGHAPREIIREIEVLLAGSNSNGGSARPRAVLYVCEESALVQNDYSLAGGTMPNEVLPVLVPCLGMLTPFYMLYPICRGAVKVGLLSCPGGRCRKSGAMKSLIDDREMTAILLTKLGIGQERLEILTANSLAQLEKELTSFSESLDRCGPLPSFTFEPTKPLTDAAGPLLGSLLGRPEFRSLQISGLTSIPFGMVETREQSSCTFCGVCEKRCPADALAIIEEEGRRTLTFKYGECVACGACVRACTERVLSLKRELDAEKLAARQAAVLAVETRVLCTKCGSPFMNEALMRKLSEELPAREAEFITQLCTRCRVQTALRGILVSDMRPEAAHDETVGVS